MSLGLSWQEIPGGIKSFGGTAQNPAAWPRARERTQASKLTNKPTLLGYAGHWHPRSHTDPLPTGSPRQPRCLACSPLINRSIWPHHSGAASPRDGQAPQCSLIYKGVCEMGKPEP